MQSNGSESGHKEIYLNQTQTCFDDDKKGTEKFILFIFYTIIVFFLIVL